MVKTFPPVEWLNSPYAMQSFYELNYVLQKLIGVKSVLEVGSGFGHTMRKIAEVAAAGAKLRIIDIGSFPDNSGNFRFDLTETLFAMCNDLKSKGFDADLRIGDSRDDAVISWAANSGPYDFVFIDGDHSYEGVKADWKNYGPMGTTIALHDICYCEGVSKLWTEIKNNKSEEVIGRPMGIGLMKW